MAWEAGANVVITPSWGAGSMTLDVAWTFAAVTSAMPNGAWWGPLTGLGRGATEGVWDFDGAKGSMFLWVMLSPVYGHRLLIAGLDGVAGMPLRSGMGGTGNLSPGVVPVTAPVPFNWAVP